MRHKVVERVFDVEKEWLTTVECPQCQEAFDITNPQYVGQEAIVCEYCGHTATDDLREPDAEDAPPAE